MAIDTKIGSFLPTTQIFDIENLDNIKLNSPEFKDFLVRLRHIINEMSIVINTKETGIYDLTEFVTGQVWFPDPALSSQTSQLPRQRQVFRKSINFGALPNTGTTNVAHGITFPASNTYSFIKIYGAATDQTGGSYLPLPYASPTAANNIELSVDNTNISITTGSDRTAYTICWVVLEYIKE